MTTTIRRRFVKGDRMMPDNNYSQNADRRDGIQTKALPRDVAAEFDRVSLSLPRSLHDRLIQMAAEMAPLSCDAALAFIKTSPFIVGRIGGAGLASWCHEGLDILRRSEQGGVAYFRLEMSRSVQLLEDLSPGVSLSNVRSLLEAYCLALSGRKVKVLSPSDSVVRLPGSDTVLLASFVARYTSKPENFAWYKVAATHQVGHIEFGSNELNTNDVTDLGRALDISPGRVTRSDRPPTGLAEFIGWFDNPRLALDIFSLVEDGRVDFLVKRCYRGVGQAYRRAQDEAIDARPPLMPSRFREAMLEMLVRLSLGRPGKWPSPAALQRPLHLAARIMRDVMAVVTDGPDTSVADSAAATMRLYRLFNSLPGNGEPAGPWDTFDTEGVPGEILNLSQEEITGMLGDLPDYGNDASPHDSPAAVDYRGTFRLDTPRETETTAAGEDGTGGSPPDFPPQTNNGASDSDDLSDMLTLAADGEASSEETMIFGTNTASQEDSLLVGGRTEPNGADSNEDGALENDSPLSFLYDEWDFRAGDYRLNWCRVRQIPLAEGSPDFFEAILAEHGQLVARLGKRFEQLNPESSQKAKRLPDGEDYDLDAVVDAVIARKAGQSVDARVYWQRNKAEREVSVAFLLDMSSSTVEYINRVQGEFIQPAFAGHAHDYSEWLKSYPDDKIRPMEFKRIIDLEKESTVLLIRALEMVGDSYALYGFSGHGRGDVEFYPIKDFGEDLTDRVKARIDGITPRQGTRMGPAIRHTVSKLEQCDSKTRVLFLISDGRPEDHGYGKHGLEREYAANDTRMALLEARRRGITPFCLTVDRSGHDYLGAICGDMSYEVVADIESLPLCLPTLYGRFTA